MTIEVACDILDRIQLGYLWTDTWARATHRTRAPFWDRDVMAFAWRLPMAMKPCDGKGKWILRRLLDRYVPRELIERPKMGFGITLDDWLRGPLREWAGDLLAEDRLRRQGYLHPESSPAPGRRTCAARVATAIGCGRC